MPAATPFTHVVWNDPSYPRFPLPSAANLPQVARVSSSSQEYLGTMCDDEASTATQEEPMTGTLAPPLDAVTVVAETPIRAPPREREAADSHHSKR